MPRWPSQGTEIETGIREALACVVVVLYCDFFKFLQTISSGYRVIVTHGPRQAEFGHIPAFRLHKVCRLGGSGLQWRTITPDTLIRFMLSTVSIEDALASGLLN